MVLLHQLKYVLATKSHRQLALWLVLQGLNGKCRKGVVIFDAVCQQQAAEILGVSVKTVQNWYKLLISTGWAGHAHGKTYLRGGLRIAEMLTGLRRDASERLYKLVLPEFGSKEFVRMVRNIKAFLYAAATKASVDARKKAIIAENNLMKSGLPPGAGSRLSRARRTKQSSRFVVYGNDLYDAVGTEKFDPTNLAVRFDAKRYNRHYSTISRYKSIAAKYGWVEVEHNYHVAVTVKVTTSKEEAKREANQIAAELSVKPGFGIGRTSVSASPVSDAYLISVQLTDTIFPNVQAKKVFGFLS